MCIRSCKENSVTANLAIVCFFSILILCPFFILHCVCWIYPFDLLSLSLETFILMLPRLRAFIHNWHMTEEWSKNSVYFAAFSFVSFPLRQHGPFLCPVTLLCLEQGDTPHTGLPPSGLPSSLPGLLALCILHYQPERAVQSTPQQLTIHHWPHRG